MREAWLPNEYILLRDPNRVVVGWMRSGGQFVDEARWGFWKWENVPSVAKFLRSFEWSSAGGEGVCGEQAVETLQAEVA
jgi:hypothetical protein